MIFEISDTGELVLADVSKNPWQDAREKKGPHFSPIQLQLSGVNNCDHSFAKHNGTSGSKNLRCVSHTVFERGDTKKLELVLADSDARVTLHYELYSDISCVRSWSEIENISENPIGVEYISSFAFNGLSTGDQKADECIRVMIPHSAWYKESNWKSYSLSELGYEKRSAISWKKIAVSNSGTWSTKDYLPMGALVSPERKSAMLWQIESNNSWQWEISDAANDLYLCLSGPTEQESHWHKELRTGERFESVKVCVAFGEDFDSSLAEMTKYRRKITNRSRADGHLPVIFNDYMNCLWANPTEEKSLALIDKAASLGAEYYCMDAGWYADGFWWDLVGEWKESRTRFPNGLRKVFDYVRSKGMIPGIWVEIEVMGINCPLARVFDDDCFFVRHGRRVIDSGRYQLDFRNPRVREHATKVIDRLVTEYGVGYIKNDYNIESGIGTELYSDSFGDGLLSHSRAVCEWVAEIKAKYPELIWENCSSGGMRMDYAQLSVADIQSTSDQNVCEFNTHIAASVASAVLPEQAAVWAYPLASDTQSAFITNMVNALPLRIHLSGEAFNWSNEQMALVREAIDCYKATRSGISEAIPFYPLGIPQYSDKNFCSAYKLASSIRLAVWRLDGGCESIFIPIEDSADRTPKILFPSVSASRVESVDGGIKVILPEPGSAVYIEL